MDQALYPMIFKRKSFHLCLIEKGVNFEKELFVDVTDDYCQEVLTAKYGL